MSGLDWIIAIIIVSLWNGFLMWRMKNEKNKRL